jgi:hypothetical protein
VVGNVLFKGLRCPGKAECGHIPWDKYTAYHIDSHEKFVRHSGHCHEKTRRLRGRTPRRLCSAVIRAWRLGLDGPPTAET